MKEKQVIILLGSPGSGKGTQAGLTAKKFGLAHLETSDILEERFRQVPKTREVKEAERLYKSGKLVTPSLVVKWINREIEKLHHKKRGIVFDGSPRTLFEAKKLFPILVNKYGIKNIKVIYIDVGSKECIWRNTRRKICAKCDKPIPYTKQTKNLKTCSECGGKLIMRKIDKPEIIKKRLKVFKKETYPVIKFFKNKSLLKKINGEQSIGDVFKDILKVIK